MLQFSLPIHAYNTPSAVACLIAAVQTLFVCLLKVCFFISKGAPAPLIAAVQTLGLATAVNGSTNYTVYNCGLYSASCKNVL